MIIGGFGGVKMRIGNLLAQKMLYTPNFSAAFMIAKNA